MVGVYNALGDSALDGAALSTIIRRHLTADFPPQTPGEATPDRDRMAMILLKSVPSHGFLMALDDYLLNHDVKADIAAHGMASGFFCQGYGNDARPALKTIPSPVIILRYIVPSDQAIAQRQGGPSVANFLRLFGHK